MSHDSSLDALLRRARAAEAPNPTARAQVRRNLRQRIASNDLADRQLEAALFEPPPRPWSRALTWGLPAIGLGLLAVLLGTPSPAPFAPSAPSAATDPAVAAAPLPAAAPVPAAAAAAAPVPAAAPAPAVAAAPVPSRTATAPAAAAPPSLLAESQALARVQRALRDGAPSQALSLLSDQDREFAHGALLEERAAARVFALCNSGRNSDARSSAAAFLARYPQSVLATRVQNSCAASASPPPPPARIVAMSAGSLSLPSLVILTLCACMEPTYVSLGRNVQRVERNVDAGGPGGAAATSEQLAGGEEPSAQLAGGEEPVEPPRCELGASSVAVNSPCEGRQLIQCPDVFSTDRERLNGALSELLGSCSIRGHVLSVLFDGECATAFALDELEPLGAEAARDCIAARLAMERYPCAQSLDCGTGVWTEEVLTR